MTDAEKAAGELSTANVDASTEELDLDALTTPSSFEDDKGNSYSNKSLDAPAGTASKTEEAEGKGKTPADPVAPAANADADTQFRATLQAQLRAKHGDSIEVPKEVTRENYLDYVAKISQPRLHPEALRLQQALERGAKPEEYFQNYGAIDARIRMGDTDLMRLHIKEKFGKSEENPDGWDDEKVEAALQAKERAGSLMFDAEELRGQLRKHKAEQQAEVDSYGQPPAPPDMNDPKVYGKFKQDLTAAFNEVAKDGKLYGLDLGKAEDQAKWLTRAEELLKPDETGVSQTVKQLQSNNGILKAAILLDMAEKGLINAEITKRVEQVKNTILGELDQNPPASAGNPNREDGALDLEALGRPTILMDGQR